MAVDGHQGQARTWAGQWIMTLPLSTRLLSLRQRSGTDSLKEEEFNWAHGFRGLAGPLLC